ncbi:MAG TPA: IPT/TIG domain-containing protein [Streptosporangiaceae bacterium]
MTETMSKPPSLRDLVCVGNWQARFGPHGVMVSSATWVPAPRPRGAIRVLPEPFDELLGRHYDVAAVLEALRAGSRVNVWGECGIGKTSLLRQVAHWAAAEFGDRPVVFATAARKPLEDLLHEIHGCLFESATPAKWRADQVREQLRRAQAVVVIDDMTMKDAELADLLWALSESLVVVASPDLRNDPSLAPIELDGLDSESAIELFLRGLGDHYFGPVEPEAVRRLTGPELLRGHPLQVLQAAALVASGRHTIIELTRVLQFGDPADRLAQECLNALSPDERQVVAVLALAAGNYLPADLAARMTPTEHVLDHLYVLRQRHVIDNRWDWFGLPVCAVGEPLQLIVPSLDLGFALRGLIAWLHQPDISAEELTSVSGCVLAVLQFAREADEWDSALEIVRAIEPALFIGGRWDQWRAVMRIGVQAAGHLGDDGYRAYCLHQLGSRALCLSSREQAARLLTQAASLRSGRHAREARSVTAHNLALITPQRRWPRSAATTTAAAVILAAGGLAAVSHFFHPSRSLLLLPPQSPNVPGVSTPGSATPSFPSLSPGKTPGSASPSASATPVFSLAPPVSPVVATIQPSSSSPATGPGTRQTNATLAVSAISPVSGPAAGATTVTITGSGFTGATQVDFGRASALSMTVDSDTQITATSPPGSGTVDITVVTSKGKSATHAADRFTYVAPILKVTGVSPRSGPAAGGTTVTISGSGFTDAGAVDFGGTRAVSMTVDSDTQITATSPAGTGTVHVIVITPGGRSAASSADKFSYVSG